MGRGILICLLIAMVAFLALGQRDEGREQVEGRDEASGTNNANAAEGDDANSNNADERRFIIEHNLVDFK